MRIVIEHPLVLLLLGPSWLVDGGVDFLGPRFDWIQLLSLLLLTNCFVFDDFAQLHVLGMQFVEFDTENLFGHHQVEHIGSTGHWCGHFTRGKVCDLVGVFFVLKILISVSVL